MINKDLLCDYKGTLRDALSCIDNNSRRTVFCVNENNILMGILTDGDIRRLILDGYGLNEQIAIHMNRNYTFGFQDEPLEVVFNRFSEVIQIIPIVNREREIVDFIEYNKNMHVSIAEPQLAGNEYKYLLDAFLSTWISSTGKYVTEFEKKFADYCGVKYGVSTSNGTTALHLALVALGIGEGDEVIVPDLTFAATINAVIYTGAIPVIVDIDEESWCISPDRIEEAITEHTKAIIPVHLYGQPCDMGRIMDIATRYNLYVIEDCAEAHGAMYDGKKVGSFGDISCFSFFGNKVITTGEGGMCITNDSSLEMKMRMLRDHGMSKTKRYYHEQVGFNYRMTNLQAAIGVAQIERIDDMLSWRSNLEKKYRQKLLDGSIVLQNNKIPYCERITWLVSILVKADERDAIIDRLKRCNVDVRKFFYPLHTMDIYSKYTKGDCIVSQKISNMGINLPTTMHVDDKTIEVIRECICKKD